MKNLLENYKATISLNKGYLCKGGKLAVHKVVNVMRDFFRKLGATLEGHQQHDSAASATHNEDKTEELRSAPRIIGVYSFVYLDDYKGH